MPIASPGDGSMLGGSISSAGHGSPPRRSVPAKRGRAAGDSNHLPTLPLSWDMISSCERRVECWAMPGLTALNDFFPEEEGTVD